MDCTVQPSTTGLDAELNVMGIQSLASYSSCRNSHQPRPPRQWLCPCASALEQGPSVTLFSWLPADKS